VLLDQEFAAWALSDSSVQLNITPGCARCRRRQLGRLPNTVVLEESSLEALATYLCHKVIKKSDWDALRGLLHQGFVGLSDLSTDCGRLLKSLLSPESLFHPPLTIILRGLPSSGQSHLPNICWYLSLNFWLQRLLKYSLPMTFLSIRRPVSTSLTSRMSHWRTMIADEDLPNPLRPKSSTTPTRRYQNTASTRASRLNNTGL
jgi:hypothetical protein